MNFYRIYRCERTSCGGEQRDHACSRSEIRRGTCQILFYKSREKIGIGTEFQTAFSLDDAEILVNYANVFNVIIEYFFHKIPLYSDGGALSLRRVVFMYLIILLQEHLRDKLQRTNRS